jgi:multidrug efflux pump subunit AcrA (membrane-fusion protein)
LFEIDPAILESQVLQADAESRALAASLRLHDSQTTSLEARLQNADQILGIEQRDYETSENLYREEKVGTQRDLDAAQQKFLRQRGVVLDLQAQLAAMPHRQSESQARLDAARARLARARHDLENAKIHCPFDARVERVDALTSQVVTAFLAIARLTDIEAFEISVGIEPADLEWLDESIRPDALSDPKTQVHLAPDVAVNWSLPDHEFSWRGRVTRFERMDEVTRTAQAVVEVRGDDIQSVGRQGQAMSPDLSVGMYCRVALPARPLHNAIRVPRHVIHNDQFVYVFEPEAGDLNAEVGQLQSRRVPRLRSIGDDVLVDFRDRGIGGPCDLQPGELLVVTPLVKPVSGMRVRLVRETQTADTLPSRFWNQPDRPGDSIAAYLKDAPRVTFASDLHAID